MQYKFFENKKILLYYDVTKQKWNIKNIVTGIHYDLSSNDNLSCFLQIFYENPSTFFENLSEKAKEKNISDKVLDTLPFKATVLFCIKNRMFFWLDLSVKWLEFLNLDGELEEAINIAIGDPKFPQNIRHKLKKLLNDKQKRLS